MEDYSIRLFPLNITPISMDFSKTVSSTITTTATTTAISNSSILPITLTIATTTLA